MFVVLVTFFIEVRVLFVDDVFVMLHTVIDLVGIVIDTFVNFPMVVTHTFFEEVFGVKVPDADLTPRRFETLAKIEAYFAARAA